MVQISNKNTEQNTGQILVEPVLMCHSS